MKKISLLIIAVLLGISATGQAPGSFNYQAVLRDAAGNVRSVEAVTLKVLILKGSAFGTTVYSETHNVTTNTFGLVTIELGSKDQATFKGIDWANGPYYVKITVDGTTMGTSQLLSVPYALYAETAETITGTITETDPVFSTSIAGNITSDDTAAWNAASVGSYTETDPVFEAWDKSTGISITESQISNFGTYVETETDPFYTSSAASGITAADTANWNNKPDSYTETDPVFGSSVASGITQADTSNWNNKLDSESQNLSDIIAINNSANGQIKNVTDPTDAQDAATKAYVDALKDIIYEELLNAGLNGIVKDKNGNTYKTIKIGMQVWMAENLKTTKYNDGSVIPLVTDNTAWENLSTPGYCWYDNDSASYAQTYGALYNWYTVETGNLCPTGWHVPTDTEWTTLTDYLGGESVAGGKLKETDTIHWDSPNTGATNETDFTALPSGGRTNDGTFGGIGEGVCWWSATEFSSENVYRRVIHFDSNSVQSDNFTKEFGFSVRCVRD